jgi:hypothetical protein
MRLPLFILKTGGSKGWFVPHALNFLGGPPWPKTIVEPFAGSAIVGLTLLNERYGQRLVLAEKDKDYLVFWRAALSDSNFSYRVSVPGVKSYFAQMTDGGGRAGGTKKWELLVNKC